MMLTRPRQAAVFTASVCLALIANDIVTPGPNIQLVMLVCAVGLLGLPHGAFDLPLARLLWPLRGFGGVAIFVALYLGLAGAVLVLWIFLPRIALIAFLAYSAWHFSSDWTDHGALWRIGGGLSTVGIPALFHPEKVAAIFVVLGVADTGAVLVPVLAVGGVLGATAILLAALKRPILRLSVEIGLLWVAGAALPPLVYFIVYFCFLHSLRHVSGVWQDLKNQPYARVEAATMTVVTLCGAGGAALYLTTRGGLEAVALQTVFVGLAALTVPHMVLTECSRRHRALRH